MKKRPVYITRRRVPMNKSLMVRFPATFFAVILLPFFLGAGLCREGAGDSALLALLPEIPLWEMADTPQHYLPESLFEYIDGAAEIYLSYDFRELIVGQFKKKDTSSSLTLEIYDMQNAKNAFGIYSAERYPESRFLPVGLEGYIEEGALNFFVERYYIKLVCYECEPQSEDVLRQFAEGVFRKIPDKGSWPSVMKFFPPEGLVPYSEKFILRNFLGFEFLSNGFVASYKQDGLEFDGFFIEEKNPQDAEATLQRYISSLKKNNDVEAKVIPGGYHLKDRYLQNIFLGRVDHIICGIIKVKDGFEETGQRCLQAMAAALKK
jgi:hypothetical protein